MTLVGALIGIVILSIALTAEVRLLSGTIRREVDLRNLIIATNLAREGVETAFSWRCSLGWDTLQYDLKDRTLCADIHDLSQAGITEGSECETKDLNLETYYDSGKQNSIEAYLYNGSSLATEFNGYSFASFRRVIKITSCADNISPNDCLLLSSEVWWDPNNRENKGVTLTKKIYNWYIP